MKERDGRKHWKPRSKYIRFLWRYRRLLLMGAAVAAILIVIFVAVPAAQGMKEESPAAQQTEAGQEVLGVIDGDDPLLPDMQKAAMYGEAKIGVTLQEVAKDDYAFLAGMEKAAAKDKEAGVLKAFEVRDAGGNSNQQIQDVYTMINNGISVLIVAETDSYNFGKISEICRSNDVLLVGYNMNAASGFAVNVISSADAAGDFAAFIKSTGQESTNVLKGTSEQRDAIRGVLTLDAQYDDMWDAIYEIGQSVNDGHPKESIIVFDYNSSDVLRSWLQKNTVPKAQAGIATVNFIKTWYQLLNGGVEFVPEPANEDTAEEEAADGGASVAEAFTVSATSGQFQGFAVTAVENAGDIVYTFALELAKGNQLGEENLVYEIEGYETITNENLAQYYEQVKDEDGGLVYSSANTQDIVGLFTGAGSTVANDGTNIE